MTLDLIKDIIEQRTTRDGLTETGILGVQFFRATSAIPCVPAASTDDPLHGVFISLDPRVMTKLAMEIEHARGTLPITKTALRAQGIKLAHWDASFSDALLRLLQITADKTDVKILSDARMRELFYAILRGEAGVFARRAFGACNAIAKSIAHVAAHLDKEISIDMLAQRAGMSRAAFHRKLKQITTMAPIQLVKSMRLNQAAMKIACGLPVHQAALDVGYVSPSQFSREFKRMYGLSPRQWGDTQNLPIAVD